jgi:hypothetical protein
MNRWVALILLFGGLCAERMQGATLRWDDPNKPGTVRAYKVYRNGPLPAETPLRDPIVAREAELEPLQLFAGAPSGRYLVSVSCVGTNSVEGDKSAAIVVRWDIRTRAAVQEQQLPQTSTPSAMTGCTNVAARREMKGVVCQAFQDKAHSYMATRFQATATGSDGICRLELDLKKFHEPKGDLTFYVWGDYHGKPAALIATSSTKVPAGTATNEWCGARISFHPIPGEMYWLGASSSAPDAANNFVWFGGGPGTRCHSADGIVWVFSANEGMNFRLFE